MGGKTETYSDFYAQRIYADDSKLLSKEFIRQFANYQTISPNLYMNNIVNQISRYFSVEVLKKYNVHGIVNLRRELVTYDTVLQYINQNYTGDNKVPFYFGTIDIDGNSIHTDAYKAKVWFDSNFYQDTSFIRSFNISYRAKVLDEGNCNGMTAKDVHIMLYGTDIVDVSIDIDTYMYSKDGIYRAIKSPIDIKPATDEDIYPQILTEVYIKEDDGSYTYDRDEYIDFVDDKRVVYPIKYAYGELCDNTMADTTILVFKKDIETSVSYTTCLVLPIKDNGSFVSLEDYQKVLLNDYGFYYDDLKSELEQSSLKSALLTYSTNRNNALYKQYLDDIYGPIGNIAEITIESQYYDWSYTETTEYDYYGDPVTAYSTVLFEGYSKIDNGENLYLLPIEIVNNMTLEEKYQFIEQCFSLYGFSSETVEIKWYQTGFFKFITLVISFAIAIFTGQVQYIGIAIGIGAATVVIAQILGPEAAAIFAIVAAVVTMGSSLTWSLSNIAQFSLQVSKEFFNAWNIRRVESISAEADYYSEEQQKLQEQLNEMTSDFVYNPFNGYNSYYDTVYNLQYAVYNSAVYSPLDTLNATFNRR